MQWFALLLLLTPVVASSAPLSARVEDLYAALSLPTSSKIHACQSPTNLIASIGLAPEQIVEGELPQELLRPIFEMSANRLCSSEAVMTLKDGHARVDGQVHDDDHARVDADVWRGAMVAVTIVSALAILGPALIPFLRFSCTRMLLDLLVALGAGVLLGDSLIHLIPSALGAHEHAHDHDHGNDTLSWVGGLAEEEEEEDHKFVWVSTTIAFTIWAMFFLEKYLLEFFGFGHSGGGHTHSHDHAHLLDHDHGHSHSHSHNHSHSHEAQPSYINQADHGPHPIPSYSSLAEEKRPLNPDSSPASAPPLPARRSVGWFIFFADFIHNFIDGVAIGASFAVSRETGFSSTLAIILHEIPHEVADFAILISVGFSKTSAVIMCLANQLTGFLGAVMGVYLGSNSEAVDYLIGATAGMFIYLALVDLMPLLEFHPAKTSVAQGLGRNVAILLGIGLMILISIIEADH